MSNQTNFEYFAGRAAAERLLSHTATDPRAQAAHEEMANRYVDLAAQFLDASQQPALPEVRIAN
jgi:hypothetical protein